MSSSSIPAAKRRRIEAANQALSKPFRSPLINRPKATSSASLGAESTSTSVDTAASRGVEDPGPAETPTKQPSGLHRRKARVSYPTNAAATTTSKLDDCGDDDGDGVLAQMRARGREADELVRTAERDLETAREAARIEARSLARRPGEEIDSEMRELVERWRAASRTAADELLSLIGDRVAGMGGAKAWRESRQRQAEFFQGFNDGERTGRRARGDGSENGEDDTGSAAGGEDVDGDPLEHEERRETEEETGEETDFTMHMMLKSLNIDPEVLGYDPVEDRWRE